jgi:predicted Zn-dependent peptidase
MSRRLFPVVPASLLLLAAALASAQSFPVEKFTLKNGMTVILYPDHGLPVASVNIWYRVGSKDEPPRRSGFAHLFEHLMFMGTERVPNGDFDRIMEAAGGSNNASTAPDRTNYFSSGPASLLPTLLWLDADRLEDLARTMDQKKLDLQRDVVLNELRQTYENQPYGRAELAIQYLLYPAAHPYHFPTIGTEEDLKAAQVNDVKDFFATYYTPSNASLVVAGDFDPKEIRPLVEKLFASLPRGADVPRRPIPPAALDGVKRGVAFDKVQLPQLSFAYHAPKAFGPGDAETDLVAAVLADGKSSRLYKRLVVDDALASSVTANNASELLGSVFRIDVQTRPDADLDRVEKVVDEELARFLKEGPTQHELDQRKATIEAGKLAALQRLETRADSLNEYEFFWGEPNGFQRDLDRYRNATPAAVLQTARRVITQNARVLFRVLPEQPKRVPGPRDARPKDGRPASFRPPAPERFTLANGIPVQFWHAPDLPLTAAALVFQPGGPLTAPDGRDAGLASLTAQMLDEGAGDLDALRFEEAVAALGGRLSASAGHEALEVSLTVLSRNFARGASLLADAVRRPRLEDKDFARVKRLTLDDLVQSDERPDEVAGRVASRALYGGRHPFAWPVDGTPASVEAITLERVKAERAALVRPDLATLLVAGSLSAADAKAALENALGDWKAEGPRPPAVPLPQAGPLAAHGLRVFLVDRPEAPQTVVRFSAPAPKFTDPARPKLRLLGTILGGSFTSRLNQNLREKNGFAYGASARFGLGRELGVFSAGADVTAKVTGASLKEFLAEFARLSGGDVTAEETGKARDIVKNSAVQAFSGLSGILATATSYVELGAPFETLGEDLAAQSALDASALNAAAKTALALDRGVLVLVGDKATILPQLKDLPLPAPVEVDTWGNPKSP